MRYFGREGIERVLRSHIAMAQEFAAWVDADARFERVAPAPFSVVCFRYKGSDEQNKQIMDAVNASGKVFLSNTVLNGKFVLRIAIGNLGTSMDDVKTAWQLLCEQVAKL
jgi:aromatic-L-amino-acid decarboxylase